MKFAPKHIASLASALLLLSACGQKDGETPGDGDAKALAGNGSELDTALRCWALTSSAYFQHMAMAGETGNLPKPDEAIYTGWAKKLAILSFNKGMGFKAFNEMKDKAKGDVRIYSLAVDPERAAAVQTCIDTVPPPTSEPDPSWPSDS